MAHSHFLTLDANGTKTSIITIGNKSFYQQNGIWFSFNKIHLDENKYLRFINDENDVSLEALKRSQSEDKSQLQNNVDAIIDLKLKADAERNESELKQKEQEWITKLNLFTVAYANRKNIILGEQNVLKNIERELTELKDTLKNEYEDKKSKFDTAKKALDELKLEDLNENTITKFKQQITYEKRKASSMNSTGPSEDQNKIWKKKENLLQIVIEQKENLMLGKDKYFLQLDNELEGKTASQVQNFEEGKKQKVENFHHAKEAYDKLGLTKQDLDEYGLFRFKEQIEKVRQDYFAKKSEKKINSNAYYEEIKNDKPVTIPFGKFANLESLCLSMLMGGKKWNLPEAKFLKDLLHECYPILIKNIETRYGNEIKNIQQNITATHIKAKTIRCEADVKNIEQWLEDTNTTAKNNNLEFIRADDYTFTVFASYPFYQSNIEYPGTWFPFAAVNNRKIKTLYGKNDLNGDEIKKQFPEMLIEYFINNEKLFKDFVHKFGNIETLCLSMLIGGGFWNKREGQKLKKFLYDNYAYDCEYLRNLYKNELHIFELMHDPANRIYVKSKITISERNCTEINQWLSEHGVSVENNLSKRLEIERQKKELNAEKKFYKEKEAYLQTQRSQYTPTLYSIRSEKNTSKISPVKSPRKDF